MNSARIERHKKSERKSHDGGSIKSERKSHDGGGTKCERKSHGEGVT
jgi:hypothetical protein